MADNTENLLEVHDLSTHFFLEEGIVKAVNNLSFSLSSGEVIGLVGETGAGKTTTALSIMRLIQSPPGLTASGTINFNGQDLLQLSEAQASRVRGSQISMIFQDPMTSLNPVMPVRDQIAEVVLLHKSVSKMEAMERADEMLEKVGIRKERGKDYPHQFSGGMRQRVVIAIALACNPKLLIADEPTTALDVTIQAQVLELMRNLKQELNTSMIMITHDLGIVVEICDKVAIMYAGTIVESAPTRDLFTSPKHPYTIGLFNSIPVIDRDEAKLTPIKGLTPDPMFLPEGCPFHPRCDKAMPECSQQLPKDVESAPGHFVKCLLYGDTKGA
ncbi:MAG: ABC transporter ATP-binding protein [Defluviitaleaceae bacterium]|nr:ABC transporter ATP-binding protein [Defluviitaleaceae bacterium]